MTEGNVKGITIKKGSVLSRQMSRTSSFFINLIFKITDSLDFIKTIVFLLISWRLQEVNRRLGLRCCNKKYYVEFSTA